MNGTEFIFKGLQKMGSIKSLANISIAILEEAEDIGESSWIELEPTIRAPKSELWVIYNPKREGSAVDKRFRKFPPEDAVIAEIHYRDNPWLSEALKRQRIRDMEVMDASTYRHVWDGDYLKSDEATVFANKWKVEEFIPAKNWDGAYFGLDFGFSQDPTAAVKVWIFEENLYIEYEAFKTGLELDDTAHFVKNKIPDIEKYVIRADCARPESISYLKRHGLPRVIACKKGKGSVEDGISFIKSHKKVIIHPRCKEIIKEFSLYSHKVDRITGDIMPEIIDAFNHGIDSIRYSIEPAMKRKKLDYSKML